MSADRLLSELASLRAITGNTPVVRLTGQDYQGSTLMAKLEFMNPTGSHKDRIAIYMVESLVRRRAIGARRAIVEASSGNTAISVAWIARRLGLKAIIVVEQETSPQKKAVLRLLGARVLEAPAGRHIELAEEIAEKENAVYLKQQANIANLRAHYETTGPEIYKQTGGRLDYFVMAMGTCGTIAGVAMYLKPRIPRLRVIGVTPRDSRLVGGSGEERIEGLSSRDVPELCTKYRGYVDEVVEISYHEALKYAKMLISREGILAGVSTGAMYATALEIARRDSGSRILFIAADSAYRYPELLG